MSTQPTRHFAMSAIRFAGHFLEMCMAMCAGAFLLSLAFFTTASALGYGNLPESNPMLATFVLAVNVSIPMVLWMRLRGMSWRLTLEMAGASMAVGVALILSAWTGVMTKGSIFEWMIGLACPSMLLAMVPRYKHYSASMSHSRHAHA